jgi:ATP-binding cassette subfamily B protein RaxB
MLTILQSESSECGLACLAMVSGYHGQRFSLRELRQRFPLSLKGANLIRLISIAGQLGLQCRPLRLDLEDLDQLKTPCILHWDLNHFVVLAKAGKKKVTIVNPAFGKRELTYKEVSDHFTGVALELIPADEFKPRKSARSVSIRQHMFTSN